MNVSIWIAVPVMTFVAVAAEEDLRTRRVPNLLTGAALLFALLSHGASDGRSGLVLALGGALLAGGVLLPGWLAGWMGAGDVKLMAALGAWFGYPRAGVALLATLLAGGVLAAIVAARHGVLRRSLANAARLGGWVGTGAQLAAPVPATCGLRFPFAIAAGAGALAAIVVPL